jgi:glucans biosynthesis protein C
VELAPATVSASRRHGELDFLRAAVVTGLAFFHTACIFRPEEFYLNDRRSSYALAMFVFFAQMWGMPLMFMVAGGGIWHSLRVRTAGGFARERLRRLLIPLVVGALVVVPPQLYFALRSRVPEAGSYWHFLGRFFDIRLTPGVPWIVRRDGADSLFDIAHLWFLYYLLVYSVLLLPVFLRLRRPTGRWLVARLVSLCQRPWGTFLLALPVALLEMVLGTWDAGGWNNYAYILFLVYGFLIAADRRLGAAIRRDGLRSLAVGVAVLPMLLVISHFDLGGPGQDLGSGYSPWSVVWRMLKAIGGWAWTAAILGLAPFLVRFATRWRGPVRADTGEPEGDRSDRRGGMARYVNEAVLPFYVLHQTPIVIFGFYVVQWRVGVAAKFLTISLTSLLVTILVYDLCVRRSNVTRVLFGMGPGETARRKDPGATT